VNSNISHTRREQIRALGVIFKLVAQDAALLAASRDLVLALYPVITSRSSQTPVEA
jgi:hypothetical protein